MNAAMVNIVLRSAAASSVTPCLRSTRRAVARRREGEQADRGSARQRGRGGNGAGHDGQEEEAGGHRVVPRQKGRADQARLVGPRAAEVVRPGARLQVVIGVEGQHHARKRVVRACLGRREDLLPVAVLLVDVGAGRLAGRAGGALRVRRVAQPSRLGVELLDKRDRTHVVAPRLAREREADGHGGGRQSTINAASTRPSPLVPTNRSHSEMTSNVTTMS